MIGLTLLRRAFPRGAGFSFFNGVGTDFQAPYHKIHQSLPVLECQIGSSMLPGVEKFTRRSHFRADHAVAFVGQLQQRAQAEGQQVHGHQIGWTDVFCHDRNYVPGDAPVFEHVVVFILDLPPRPPCRP